MSSVIFIRHGESLGNADNQFYKCHDSANILTQNGVMQCLELSKQMKDLMEKDWHNVHTTVVSSRYQRAKLTAEIVMSEFRMPFHTDLRLNEQLNKDGIGIEPRELIVRRVRSLVLQYEFNLILFTHGMLMGALDPEKGGARNAEWRKYDREELLNTLLKE